MGKGLCVRVGIDLQAPSLQLHTDTFDQNVRKQRVKQWNRLKKLNDDIVIETRAIKIDINVSTLIETD